MPITQSSLVDILFKKVANNVATTDNRRQFFEEPYSSNLQVFNQFVWLQSDLIPVTNPVNSDIIQQVTATLSWVAGSSASYYNSNLLDIIPQSFGSSYSYYLTRNDGTQITNVESDWYFDPASGVLTFYSVLGSNGLVRNIGGAIIASTSSLPVLRAWKYIGKKGVLPNFNGFTFSGLTLSLITGQGMTFTSNQYSIDRTNGLTFSGNQLRVDNSFGLTFSSGQLVFDNGLGLTRSGNGIIIDRTNGLTFSGNQLRVDNSFGLTFSSGQLVFDNGLGLTRSGNGIIIDRTNGLTFSGNRLQLDIVSPFTFSNSRLSLSIGQGLTNSQNLLNLTRMVGTDFPATAVGGQVFLRGDLGFTHGVPYVFNDNLNRWRGFSQIISDSSVFVNTATSSDFAFVVLPSTASTDTLFGYPLFQIYPQGGFIASSRRQGTLPTSTGTTVSISDWPYIFRISQTNTQGPRLGFYAAGTTNSNWFIQTDNGMTSSAEAPPFLEIQRVGQTIIGRSSGSRGLIIGELGGSPLSKLHVVGVGSGNIGYFSVSPSANADRELISLTIDENFGVNGQLGLLVDTSSLSGAFISPNNPTIIASMSSVVISQLKTGSNIRLIQGATSGSVANLSFGGNPILIREVGTNSLTLNSPCNSLGGSTLSLSRIIFNDKPTSHFQYQGLFSIGNPLTVTSSGLLPSVGISNLNSRNDVGGNFTGITTSSTFYSIDATTQNLTYTLPDARVSPGRLFMFNKVDSSTNSVTLQTTYTQSIYGTTSYALNYQYQSVTLVARSTGTQGFWEVASESDPFGRKRDRVFRFTSLSGTFSISNLDFNIYMIPSDITTGGTPSIILPNIQNSGEKITIINQNLVSYNIRAFGNGTVLGYTGSLTVPFGMTTNGYIRNPPVPESQSQYSRGTLSLITTNPNEWSLLSYTPGLLIIT